MPHRSNNSIIKENETKGTTCTDKGKHIHVTHYDKGRRESYDVDYGKDIEDRSNSIGNSHHHSKH